jgi:hypothetical protein
MRLNRMAQVLAANEDSPLHFMLSTGEVVPRHFHVTEVGRVHKVFVDCGGTRRESITCLLQLWVANDFDHRLTAAKLSKILSVTAPILGADDLEVEVEYASGVASQYKLVDAVVNGEGIFLVLDGKQTACLAEDKCGINQCGSEACC